MPLDRAPRAHGSEELRKFYSSCAFPKTYRAPKPPRRLRVKATPKAERRQIEAVRAACVERDGYCRFYRAVANNIHGDRWSVVSAVEGCDGPSEWAHMHTRRRSKTRGMAPEYRHDTAHSLMLCHTHHQDYDAKRLLITALTRKGANGALRFRRAKS